MPMQEYTTFQTWAVDKGNVKNKRFHELDLKRANILVLYAFLSALILSLLAVFIAYLAV